MQQDVINKILQTENHEQRMRVLAERRSEILQAIGDRTIEPTEDVLGELFDLNVMLGDVNFFGDGEA